MWQILPAAPGGVVMVDGSDMDVVSFDDSEQFEEEDSDGSWNSDPYSMQIHNWSGWKCSSKATLAETQKVFSLIELSAKATARNYPFEIIEKYQPPIPEDLQLRIAFWSFPDHEDEIRLYSCLASGSNEKFQLGEALVKSGNVRDVLQIGFHLSGVVTQPVSHTPAKQVFNVAISFDRGRITSCQCSCLESATWCEHTTAVCLYRIFNKKEISLRAPVSESLSRLERDQLQKFAQYLISELPQQILPTAQRLLDELLSSPLSAINTLAGAPDPTAGASSNDEAKWVLDEISLKENVKKILARFFGPLPVCVIEQYATLSIAPAVSLKWCNFIHSLQRRDPEAMWNLLQIVRHMLGCGDKNSVKLLTFITEECLLCYQMMHYWILSFAAFQSNNNREITDTMQSSLHKINDVGKYTSAHFMEELVHLWQLTSMNPHITPEEKNSIFTKLQIWNKKVIAAAKKGQGQGQGAIYNNPRLLQEFNGFEKAMQACDIDWSNFYQILEVHNDIKLKSRHQYITSKVDNVKESSILTLFMKIGSIVPPDMDEFNSMSVLTQALYCHGYLNKASKLASMLAQRILSMYPARLRLGENDFASITNQANSLCEILVQYPAYERTAFEIAILGLTAPRLPARNNLEEIKISYLEMSLYEKIKSMTITDEHLILIRHQAKKLLSCPTLRGEEVLPILIATFIFEVLCRELVRSNVLPGPFPITWSTACQPPNPEDQLLGYKCALTILGLMSSASDQKQPMLCESIRHQRRDLALALLFYSRWHEDEVTTILNVILNKERYPFMINHQPQQRQQQKQTITVKVNTRKSLQSNTKNHNNGNMMAGGFGGSGGGGGFGGSGGGGSFGGSGGGGGFGGSGSGAGANNETNSDGTIKGSKKRKGKEKLLLLGNEPPSGQALQEKFGFSFADINARNKPPVSRVKRSSDSDSGNGEFNDNKQPSRTIIPTFNQPSTQRKNHQQQQRRQSRHNIKNTRGAENKNGVRHNDRTWTKHNKSNKTKKFQSSHELTESDSGQEMHFSFEKDENFSIPPKDWQSQCQPYVADENASLVSPPLTNPGVVLPPMINSLESLEHQVNVTKESEVSEVVLDECIATALLPSEKFDLQYNKKTVTASAVTPDEQFDIQYDGEMAANIVHASNNIFKTEEEKFISTFVSDSSATPLLLPMDGTLVGPSNLSTGVPPPSPLSAPMHPPIIVHQSLANEDFDAGYEDDFIGDLELNNSADHIDNINTSWSNTSRTTTAGVLPAVEPTIDHNTTTAQKPLYNELLAEANIISSRDTLIKDQINNSKPLSEEQLLSIGSMSDISKGDCNHSVSNDTNLHANDINLHANDTTLHANDTTLHANDINLCANGTNLHANDINLCANNTNLCANDTNLCAKQAEYDSAKDSFTDSNESIPTLNESLPSISTIQKDTIHNSSAPININVVLDREATSTSSSKEQTDVSTESLTSNSPEIPDKVKPDDSLADNNKQANGDSPASLYQVVKKRPVVVQPDVADVSMVTVNTTNEKQVTNEVNKKQINLADLRVALESIDLKQNDNNISIATNTISSQSEMIKVINSTNEKPPPSSSSKSKKKQKKKKNKLKSSMNLQSIEAEAYSMFELAKSVLMLYNTTMTTYERLPLAALEIGLFALNIHNYCSPNWYSRTYSTYVSWIENLCVDVGVNALRMLNEQWEDTLTPTEAVQMALRASRPGDSSVKRTSAELVLSCLIYSQSLTSADITAGINLCREQDDEMLERACSAVENASAQGGIQPELLFRISREWHYLHEEKRKREEGEGVNNEVANEQEQASPTITLNNSHARAEAQSVYITPEQFVQEQMHLQAQEMLGRQLPRNNGQDQFTWIYPQYIGPLHHCPLPQQAVHSRRIPNIGSYSIPYSNFPEELNLSEIPRYLQNCYRVGMRALEGLTLPMPDDRPEVKYAMSPPSSEDIRWMCALSASLGPTCLKNFCKVVYNAVTSPFLLHDLALEAARHFALYNPAQLASHLRSPSVSPIVQKAMAMYTELVHHDLVFLSPLRHADFVDLLRRTRSAFCMAPGGMARFNEILEVIRKTYPKKRELWQLIMNGLSKA